MGLSKSKKPADPLAFLANELPLYKLEWEELEDRPLPAARIVTDLSPADRAALGLTPAGPIPRAEDHEDARVALRRVL